MKSDSTSTESPAKPVKQRKDGIPVKDSHSTAAAVDTPTETTSETIHFTNPAFSESTHSHSIITRPTQIASHTQQSNDSSETAKSLTCEVDDLASQVTTSSIDCQATSGKDIFPPSPSLGVSNRRRTSVGSGIIEGLLSKVNRDGAKVKYLFTMDFDSLSYLEDPSNLSIFSEMLNGKPKRRTLPLSTLIVRDADPNAGDTTGLSFRILSKSKSFVVTANSVEEKVAWMKDIATLSKVAQMKALGKELDEQDMFPIRQNTAELANCQYCGAYFGMLSKRHYCRNCGKTLCVDCSREKVRIPRIDEWALLKVCLECARELKNNRVYGADAHAT